MKELKAKLPDDFSKSVLEGSVRVASDQENPIRINLFASGIRELFSHILHHFAPDENVRACPWFTQADGTANVTRRQRAAYAAQGGLSDEFLAGIGLNIRDIHSDILKSIDNLNKYTHVRPGVIENDQAKIDEFVSSALGSLDELLVSFEDCRSAVRRALESAVYDAIMTAMVTRTFGTIDLLAGKGYEVEPFIDEEEYQIEAILADKVLVKFSGVAPVTLHYGSRDDAVAISHDFPFWMRFSAPVANPTQLVLEEHFFDDRSWFE